MKVFDALKDWLAVFGKQMLFVLLFALVIVFLMDFNVRLMELSRKTEQRDEILKEVYQLELTAQTLRTQIAYATSEVAVEKWAREQGHMQHPGDIPIVPLPASQLDVTPTPLVAPTNVPVSNWEVWQLLLLGE